MVSELQKLGRAIKQVQYKHHRILDAELRRIGTTLVQWDALRAIGCSPGASAHELAVETFQSDQAFGTLANRLISQGLIERKPGRGRRINHYLTPAGREILEAGHPVVNRVFAASFSQLSDYERSTLSVLLARLGHEETPFPV